VTPLDVFDETVRDCERCSLRVEDEPMTGLGPWPSPLLVVADYPTPDEVLLGRPFESPAAIMLRKHIAEAGIDHRKVRMTVGVRCGAESAVVAEKKGKKCKNWLAAELMYGQPKVVVPLGGLATRWVLGRPEKTPVDHLLRLGLLVLHGDYIVAPWLSLSQLAAGGADVVRGTVELFTKVREKAWPSAS
jgi:uracil-DNA glycosylase family 4